MPRPNIGREDLADILGVLRDVVILVDRERRIQYVSRVEEGYELEDIIGADLLDFVAPGYQDAQAQMFQKVLDTGEEASDEIQIEDAEGDLQWHEGRMIPLTRDGNIRAIVIVTRNVTDRRLAEEEAKRLRSLVPVCSWCGKIRDDDGYWQSLETYIEETAESHVTHGMCPECEADVAGGNGEKSA